MNFERDLHVMIHLGTNIQIRSQCLDNDFIKRNTVAYCSKRSSPMSCRRDTDVEKAFEGALRLFADLGTGLDVVVNCRLKLPLQQARGLGLISDDVVDKQDVATANLPGHIQFSRTFVSVVLK